MRDRTADLLDANQALSQLSYSPILTCLFHQLRRYCSSLSRSHTKVCSLLRSSRALHLMKNPALNRLPFWVIFLKLGILSRSVLFLHMSDEITTHKENLVGLGRLELPTSPLSGVRSNQLSYRPKKLDLFTLSRVALRTRSIT